MNRKNSLPRFNLIVFPTLLLLMFLIGGCSGGASPASPALTDSFQTDVNKNVAIMSTALDHEFLLQGNKIELDNAESFQGLKSRVVVFQKQGSKLFMLESPEGHTITPTSPLAIILAEFTIISEKNGWIWFDFNQGMSKIFTTSEMYISDAKGTNYQPSFTTATIRSSYLAEATASQLNQLNRLALRQAAQVEDSGGTLHSVEVRYYLYPYKKSETFKSTISPGITNTGFFEVMPQLESGGYTNVYAMKWDIDKMPITYYISADTPANYHQAVKDGVLYWNKALGKEIFVVEDAPVGVTAPNMDRNIIQWLNYDTAGSAYADIQADPRTGEILHAQIFMPSIFGVGNKKEAWRFLKSSPVGSPAKQIALINLTTPQICDLSSNDVVKNHIAALLASNASDAQILKSSQAIVQETVTHEVGHTMGLRHNFAGSLAVNYGVNKRENLYLNFLNGGTYIPVIPSSSVMDYHNSIEAALIINRYNTTQLPLPYDISAMRFLYNGTALDKTIPFCTDTDTDMIDCKRFDYGASPFEYAALDLNRNLSVDLLPVSLYLDLVTEVISSGTAVADLRPSPAEAAASLLKNKPLLLTPFTQSGLYSRALKKSFPGTLFKDVDKGMLRAEGIPFVKDDLAKWLGSNNYGITSLTQMFMIIDPTWKATWVTRFNQITNDPTFYNITDQNGTSREFTVAERTKLREIAGTFFDNLIYELVAADVTLLSAVTSPIDIVDDTAGIALLAAMNSTSNKYVTALTGTSLNSTVNSTALTLPRYMYSGEVRKAASRLMKNRAVSTALWWGVWETYTNQTTLTSYLDNVVLSAGGAFKSSVITGGFDTIITTDKPAYQWYQENLYILNKGFLYDPP